MSNADQTDAGPNPNGIKLGPLWLAPGIGSVDAALLLTVTMTNIAMITFFVFLQPYLLSEILHIPDARQGTLTGNLASLQEILLLLLMGFIGALSDTRGRRVLAAIGFAALSVSFFLYPLVASETQLYLARIIFAAGAATVSVITTSCVVAYIQNVSRGKWSGLVSVCNSLGIIFVAMVLSKTPVWLTSQGLDAELAGRYTYWIGALVCLCALPLAFWHLKEADAQPQARRESIGQQILSGLAAARANPRLPLAYTAGIIGRGDLIVVSTFLSLWVVQAGIPAGISTGESMARAGMVFGVIQTSALVWAPLMGMIVDHVNRVTALAIAMGIAATGYLMMGQVADPFSNDIFPVAIVLGMGENSVLIAGLALLGQEAPKRLYGTIVGMFLVMGSLGVILASWVGGQLFDHWSRTGPFTLMGILNLVGLIWALLLRLRSPDTPAQT